VGQLCIMKVNLYLVSSCHAVSLTTNLGCCRIMIHAMPNRGLLFFCIGNQPLDPSVLPSLLFGHCAPGLPSDRSASPRLLSRKCDLHLDLPIDLEIMQSILGHCRRRIIRKLDKRNILLCWNSSNFHQTSMDLEYFSKIVLSSPLG
jgi:hypothetical protein